MRTVWEGRAHIFGARLAVEERVWRGISGYSEKTRYWIQGVDVALLLDNKFTLRYILQSARQMRSAAQMRTAAQIASGGYLRSRARIFPLRIKQ